MSLQIPDLSDYTRVREGHVLVEYASPDNGAPGEFAPVGCLEGDFQVQRGTETIEDDITNWCTVQGGAEALASAQPGETTVTLSGTLVMLLGDEGFQQVIGDGRNRVTGYWRITATDGNTEEAVRVDSYRGFFTQLDDTYRQDGASVTAFQVRIVEVLASES